MVLQSSLHTTPGWRFSHMLTAERLSMNIIHELVVLCKAGQGMRGRLEMLWDVQKLQTHPPDAWRRGVIADYAQDCFNVLLLQGVHNMRGA